jgi:flagellar basal body-associated protein FliL
MPAEATQETQAPSPPKRNRMLTILLVLVAGGTCGAAGFAVPLLAPQAFRPEPQPAESTAAAEGRPAFVPFGETVVNLNSERFNRYLRVSITLQVYEADLEKVTPLLEKNKALLKSWLISYLSDKNMEEVRGSAGQNRLRREIHQHFNAVLFQDGYDRIRDVLFEEFNVQ